MIGDADDRNHNLSHRPPIRTCLGECTLVDPKSFHSNLGIHPVVHADQSVGSFVSQTGPLGLKKYLPLSNNANLTPTSLLVLSKIIKNAVVSQWPNSVIHPKGDKGISISQRIILRPLGPDSCCRSTMSMGLSKKPRDTFPSNNKTVCHGCANKDNVVPPFPKLSA